MAKAKTKGIKLGSKDSLPIIDWVLENYSSAMAHLRENEGEFDGYECPSESHRTFLMYAIGGKEKALADLMRSKRQIEQALARKTKRNIAMRDDQRRHFRLLDAVMEQMPIGFKFPEKS